MIRRPRNRFVFLPSKETLSEFVYSKMQSTINLAVDTNPRKRNREEDFADPRPKASKTKGKGVTRARDEVKEPVMVRNPTRVGMDG